MMRLRGLPARIVIAVVLLVASLQAVVLMLVSRANVENARDRAREELVLGEAAFTQAIEVRRQRLHDLALLLATDAALRDGWSADSRRALDRLAARASLAPAQAMQIIDAGGVRASIDPTRANLLDGERLAAPPPLANEALLARAHGTGGAAEEVVIANSRAYQVVVVPLLPGGGKASLVLAFAYDEALAQQLQQQTSLGTSFLLAAGGAAQALGSSLQAPAAQALAAGLSGGASSADTSPILRLDGREYATRVLNVGQAGEQRVIAVVQRALTDVLPVFDRLRRLLLMLGVASVVLALVASLFMAHAVTHPLRQLTRSAQRIRDGDYREQVSIRSTDEIGVLADSLDHMRQSIAAREHRIVQLAYEDALTGLPNRARLIEQLGTALQQAQRDRNSLAVMLLDVDRFKQINDTLGHPAGDAVLRQVAVRVRQAVRPTDLVARLGGDEFAFTLPGANAEVARAVARNVVLALKEPLEFDGQPIDVGASIGIAVYPDHGSDVDTLLRCADISMYAAKRNHASQAVYDSTHEVARREHLSLLGELRRAVEQSQLRAYYQPKVDLKSNRAVGAEALVRWRHPARGLLSPAEFMPYAEQTGYVRVVTRWMLAVTLRQCGAWATAGTPLQVAVNLSARDLMRQDLPRAVEDLLRTHSVPPQLVCLEITESSFMQDPERALSVLHDLHGLGVGLAIDDFGTGFSSLAYMKRLPVHELKIDATFVQGMATSEKDVSIVRSTIQLAHNLGLKVVAEGVEDERCLEALRSMDCDQAQGYLLGRPMRRSAFENWQRVRADAAAAPAAHRSDVVAESEAATG